MESVMLLLKKKKLFPIRSKLLKHMGFKKIDYVSVNLKIINFKSFEKELLRNL